MARQESYGCGLNLKATELSLALPGSDEPEQPSTSRKRSSQDQDSVSPPKKSQVVGWPPIQSHRKNRVNASGLYVKVNMDGAPYLRKIDLKSCKSYGELLVALGDMFKVKIGQSDYTSSYEDKDGDWMLVGDVPWEMFVSSCKRLRIIKTSEAKRLCI